MASLITPVIVPVENDVMLVNEEYEAGIVPVRQSEVLENSFIVSFGQVRQKPGARR